MNPVMVGIVGGSGSGKTTLAQALAWLMKPYGSRIISQDHYYRGIPAGTSTEAYNFDDPSALDLDLLLQHLQAVQKGRDIQMPQYDFSTHCRCVQTERVVPTPVMIVEGLFLYTQASLREVFDLRFFLDVPTEERLRRRIARDTRERGRVKADIVNQFEQQVEPMYQRHIEPTRCHSDHILNLAHPDARLYCEQAVEMWGLIEGLLRKRGVLLNPDRWDRIT